jgi:hypothetical protein
MTSNRTSSRFLDGLVGVAAGYSIGFLLYGGGVGLLAVLSELFDAEIVSDTIIFDGWGGAAVLFLFLGVLLPPLGAVVGGIIGVSRAHMTSRATDRVATSRSGGAFAVSK